jgi:hypothetical protein
MTGYTGRPPKYHTDCNVYFDVPDGGSGRIYIPAHDEATALAIFHLKWTAIGQEAAARYKRGDLENGEVVLDIAAF